MTRPNLFRFVHPIVMSILAMLLVLTPTSAQKPNPPKPTGPPFSLNVQLLTDPQGIDLGPCLRAVFNAIRSKSLATLPPSVATGDQGMLSIGLRIQKDGTLAGPKPLTLL